MTNLPAVALVTLFAGLAGCSGETTTVDTSSTDTGSSVVVGDETECAEASAALGYLACEHKIVDGAGFDSLTVMAGTVDQLRVGKYLVPARADARLPGAFLDVNNFQLHYDFLVKGFPELFAGLTTAQYQEMILYPETREFYGGTYGIYLDGEDFYYGFTVWDDPADASSTVTQEQVTAAWEELKPRFGVGDLVWVPNSENQATAALDWSNTPFDVANPAEVDYEAYNPGDAYGNLRLYTIEEFAQATVDASFGYQDIVVIDEAPVDIERVVSGIVTGTRQGGLSHLSVRSASRGTPNCFINEPLTELAAWKDQLVHLDCAAGGWTIEAAAAEDAQAWWDSIRPDPVDICSPDTTDTRLMPLLEMVTDTAEERRDNICTWGAKGSNLATLYQRIDPELQLQGFVIPFHYYQDFVDSGTWTVDLGDGAGLATHTFTETLDAWHADPVFLTDAEERRNRLDNLRAAMMSAPVDPAVVQDLSDAITTMWGQYTLVRFRSSSNAEDAAGFSGAGLYDSASVCVADEYDGDSQGPSRCNSDKEDERTVSDGIRTVWSSLWKISAWEERQWYGMPQGDVVMGVLVDDRTDNEQANIVAFSGNPSTVGDGRMLINAQEGELEVVAAEAGVFPEQDLLTLDATGEVSLIDRVSKSSEVDEVLTDAELSLIGAAFYDIVQIYPVDDEIPEGHDLVWDTEWKITSDGRLIIKQIRPFIR